MLGSLAGMMMWLSNLLVWVKILFFMCSAARLGGIFVIVMVRGLAIMMAVLLYFLVVRVLMRRRVFDLVGLVVMMVAISG
jgi:hypothetical protein